MAIRSDQNARRAAKNYPVLDVGLSGVKGTRPDRFLVLHDVLLGHTHERMKVTGIGPTVLLFDDFRSGLHFQGRVLLRCWGLPGLGLRLIGYTCVCRRDASNRTKNSDSGEVS